MKRVFSSILPVLVLGISSCKAQPDLPTAASNNSLLWEISGNGLKQPSYYLGTMHILCEEDAWISASLKEVLNRADVIYMEVDLDNLMEMVTSMGAMTMRNKTRLRDLLSEEEYDLVKAYFSEKLPLPFSMMENFKPMLLSSMVSEKAMPCESTNGMELMLMSAKNKKQEIKGLETLAYQAGIFDSIPYELQAKELVRSISEMNNENPEAKAEMDSLLYAYRRQDLAAIDRLTSGEGEGLEQKYLDLLLYKRNENWVEKFEEIATKQPTLFAVGAGHLPGQKGVLQLLKDKGYTLRPIANQRPDESKSL